MCARGFVTLTRKGGGFFFLSWEMLKDGFGLRLLLNNKIKEPRSCLGPLTALPQFSALSSRFEFVASFWLVFLIPRVSEIPFKMLLFQSPETTNVSWASYTAMTAILFPTS